MLGPKMPYPHPTYPSSWPGLFLGEEWPLCPPYPISWLAPSSVKNGSSYHVRVLMEAGPGQGEGVQWAGSIYLVELISLDSLIGRAREG